MIDNREIKVSDEKEEDNIINLKIDKEDDGNYFFDLNGIGLNSVEEFIYLINKLSDIAEELTGDEI
jgi:hypothetical protein